MTRLTEGREESPGEGKAVKTLWKQRAWCLAGTESGPEGLESCDLEECVRLDLRGKQGCSRRTGKSFETLVCHLIICLLYSLQLPLL